MCEWVTRGVGIYPTSGSKKDGPVRSGEIYGGIQYPLYKPPSSKSDRGWMVEAVWNKKEEWSFVLDGV